MDNFSNLMVIGECLLDNNRTRLFKNAIRDIVGNSCVVLDGGTGAGVLALFAAKSGAKKVYGVEIDSAIAEMAKTNVRLNGFENVVEIVTGDITKVSIPRVDVVTMEMMDTGLISEQQIPALNHLISTGTIDENTRVIPAVFETYIQFIHYNFAFHGLHLPIILQARNFGVLNRIKERLSEPILIHSLMLNVHNELDVYFESSYLPMRSGEVNALLMTSKIKLSSGIETWGTSDMNMPVIIPIEPRLLNKKESLNFSIEYKLAHGFNTVNFNWR